MTRGLRILAILALIAASGVATQAVFANCVETGVYEILQCANATWFAAPPAGSGHVTGWWWGIGFGNILNIGDEDLFGNEVNLASKLGEDVAERGEILLTAAARAQLHEADIPIREETVSISGLDVTYYKIQS